jgi:UDP-glucose 4-epimerase
LKKIFLTGGSGFLGQHLQVNLSQDYAMLAPTRQVLELSNSEAVDTYLEKNEGPDYILNAANVGGKRNSVNSEQDCLYENLKVFRNIFQHKNRVKKFIQFGSGAEYSKPFHKRYVSEEDVGTYLPVAAYGLSKFLCGQALENIGELGRCVNLRIFGIFGPNEDYQVRFISNAIVRSLFGLPIIVNQNAEFDYVYVTDFLKIVRHFIENNPPAYSYNITTGTPVTLIELAELVKDITNNKHDLIIKNGTINQSYSGSNERLKAFLPSHFQFTPIRQAISELIVWYESQLPLLDKERVLSAS